MITEIPIDKDIAVPSVIVVLPKYGLPGKRILFLIRHKSCDGPKEAHWARGFDLEAVEKVPALLLEGAGCGERYYLPDEKGNHDVYVEAFEQPTPEEIAHCKSIFEKTALAIDIDKMPIVFPKL